MDKSFSFAIWRFAEGSFVAGQHRADYRKARSTSIKVKIVLLKASTFNSGRRRRGIAINPDRKALSQHKAFPESPQIPEMQII
jgi:hypothetical protein